MPSSPIFLFSLPRSGSTLLQRILSTHQDINTKSELWFLLPHVEALRNQCTFSQYSNLSLRNATKGLLAQLPGGEADYLAAIRALADSIYERLAVSGEKYVLDKTPRYYLIINEIAAIYPDAKFIFLFRNPLSVAASIVESFNRGWLGDYRHRIDLFLGPELLADGYRQYRDRSIVVRYEELVRDPTPTLLRVCDYLKIEFNGDLLSNFSNVPVGVLGDQFGSKRFSTLEPDRIENWRRVFATSYRKRYLHKYLEGIGRDTVETFGYDYDELIEQVSGHAVRFSLGMLDRLDLLRCSAVSMFEGIVFREKIFRRRAHKKYFLLH